MHLFDFYLSLGPACRPARYIQYHNLRCLAAPLDWQFRYSLDTVLQLFNTSFSTFFANISENTKKEGADNCRTVIDTKNHIISIHHFSKDISLEEGHDIFRKKMLHRYEMLDNKLKQITDLAIVCNRALKIKNLEAFLVEFSHIYPQLNINLINIRSCDDMNNTEIHNHNYYVSPKLSITQYEFNDSADSITGEKYTWLGNETMWNSIFDNYDLTNRAQEFNLLKDKEIVIYGEGEMRTRLLDVLKKYHIIASDIAVPALEESISDYDELPASIESYSTDCVILIAIDDVQKSIESAQQLEAKGYHRIVHIDFNHGVFLNSDDLKML